MIKNILAVGDVCGKPGLEILSRRLRPLKKLKAIDFTVVNGENASVLGITPEQADTIFAAGADVITLGNHSFSRPAILPYLDDNKYILRPENISPLAPGRGWGIFESAFGSVCVISLLGQCEMDFRNENPFFAVNSILKQCEGIKVILVDMHAEATSEKGALGYYLDGRVSAVWGTHTHVQTSDATVLPKGTGFITDLGMTGPAVSVLGVKPEQSIAHFTGEAHRGSYEAAPGESKIECAIFSIDTDSGNCVGVEAMRLSD